jgi:hypothetical protein
LDLRSSAESELVLWGSEESVGLSEVLRILLLSTEGTYFLLVLLVVGTSCLEVGAVDAAFIPETDRSSVLGTGPSAALFFSVVDFSVLDVLVVVPIKAKFLSKTPGFGAGIGKESLSEIVFAAIV